VRSVFVFALWLAFAAAPALAAPCITSTPACTEWITPGSASVRLLVYRSFPLDVKNADITRAVVLVHGAGRDADNYFQHVLAAAFLGGALDTTVVISPRFASTNNGCADKIADREAAWECGGPARWTSGGDAVGTLGVTSFDAMDAILTRLAKREAFPNLRSIVLAGHSAGGQFVSRYEMSNQVHDKLGVPLTYIVANPSSYAYLDSTRPSASTIAANVTALAPGYHPAPPAKPLPAFVPFGDADDCTSYDSWPYGMQKRVGYSARLTDDQLKKQLASRPVTYLLGGLDILPLFGFDGSCGAMAQGPTRMARGLAYARYVNERAGAKHEVREVPSCGHNARCMFTDGAALALLFPKP
jgi:pimeloyl-ACP methyl ester carboxylesterase